jgi:hypothetical protein
MGHPVKIKTYVVLSRLWLAFTGRLWLWRVKCSRKYEKLSLFALDSNPSGWVIILEHWSSLVWLFMYISPLCRRIHTEQRWKRKLCTLSRLTLLIIFPFPFPLPLLVARSIWCLPYPVSGTLTSHCKGSAPRSSLPAPYSTYRIQRAGFSRSFHKAVLHVSLWPRSHIYMSYSLTHFSAPIYHKSPTSLPCMAETCTPLQ